ncbi:hypothetical protein CM15mP43_10840 [bacterium]|nr:MAG: hypothetical protein CM15mP43_10840 [bacterium]
MMGSTKLLMKFIKENHLLFNIILLTFIIFCAPLPKEVNSNEKLNSRFFNINEIESLIKLYNFAPYHEKYNNYSKTLVGTPYVNNVLIGSKKIDEVFIIDLNRLDCFTYVEYVHALANSNNYLEFKNKVREYRYYKGEVNFYNRNHFFIDWINFLGLSQVEGADLKERKILNKKNETEKYLEGIPLKEKYINYFSVNKAKKIIFNLRNSKNHYIVGIVSDRIGLDVSHVGFLLWNEEGKAIFRHASSKSNYMKVVEEDFLEYIKNKPGIIIFETK